MSSTEYAPIPPQPQLKMPSGSAGRSTMQSSRSSRRGTGSSAPKVLLGGGAGILGEGRKSSEGLEVSVTIYVRESYSRKDGKWG